jgi:hypothetical protein
MSLLTIVRFKDEAVLGLFAGRASFIGYEPILKRQYITADGVTAVFDLNEHTVALYGEPSAVAGWRLRLGGGDVGRYA